MEITSADPDANLRIQPNYFTTDHDRKTGANVLRRMREIFEQSPIADRISHGMFPGGDAQTDDEIVDSALDGGFCGYHAVGSCAMDSELRVRGVHNLRVVDCSVMPTKVAGNLNGPVMAMAWRAADFITQDR